MLKAKVLVIGPCDSGKSVLSNFLAEASDISGGAYHPTEGVRILEFESSGSWTGNRTTTADVELWDCSGDPKFDECWPAIAKDTQGVVIVYNPDKLDHERELETWYNHFVTNQGIKDAQCLIFSYYKPGTSANRVNIPNPLSKVRHVECNLDNDPDSVRREFKALLMKVFSNISHRQNEEELSIIQ
ncbi:Intraflagellar transport protein 22-like [Holothuria leucospilota]|uniref:Intraflagellar transport protein 22 homolog n=1 Tax=Holothuria leucospilota TaxID=206669 RepID=A0A9Q1CDK9_HOLLE|nr:Intraflagellar transport protein 22-like [Holothuria leucospilota]